MKVFSHQRGFTLLETGLTLLVGGLVIGGLWILASTISENGRKSRLTEQSIEIITNTRRVFGNASAAVNLSNPTQATAAAVAAGIFPRDMVTTGNQGVVNAYRGQVLLTHNALATPPTFRLSMDRVNPGGCVDLMSKMVRDAAIRRQYGIVGATSTQNIDQTPGHTQFGSEDLPANRMTQICGGGVFGSKRGLQPIAVHIEFRYY